MPTRNEAKTLEGYSFIDLFAGIGGFHLAMKEYHAKCVFASEWNPHAAKVYHTNFGIKPHGDITTINEADIPEHDILCGGFPCQAFSISGKQKGFEDTRGTLFFDIARIIQYHTPKIVILENVKQLLRHDRGKTRRVITKTLHSLNYNVRYKILNAGDYGLPQHRERIFFVCFRKDLNISSFRFPRILKKRTSLQAILEQKPQAKIINRTDINIYNTFEPQRTASGTLILPNKPIQIGIVNKGGQGERIYSPFGHSCTLSAYGGGVGAKTGLYLIDETIRKLSPRECARLQGFPDSFIIDRNQNQAYQQFGNSVAVDVIKKILQQISKAIHKN